MFLVFGLLNRGDFYPPFLFNGRLRIETKKVAVCYGKASCY